MIEKAIHLLTDKGLLWSSDFDTIRIDLANLLAKAQNVEYSCLEPEIQALVISLIKDSEGENDVRRFPTASQATALSSANNTRTAFKRRSEDSASSD